MKAKAQTTFEKLSSINVNSKVDKKSNLTYLSWAWAWSEVKKACPDATYKMGETEYDEAIGFMCHSTVTIAGETLEMWLPVMDSSNKSMKKVAYSYTTRYGEKQVAPATTFDINKTLMRCLVKNLAMFGLGIYIYAGEDLPEVVEAAVVVTKSDGLLPLTVKDDNWSKVTKYVVENKAMGVKRILDSLSRKYKISAPVKTAISKMIGV
tara:strand:+ start:3332 stop:3955 length:624 start_codon:yes stop_codon:yes gene_type:complete